MVHPAAHAEALQAADLALSLAVDPVQRCSVLAYRPLLLLRQGDYARAVSAAAAAAEEPAIYVNDLYNVACAYALTSKSHPGDRARALAMLAAALSQQASWIDVARADPDLEPLRGDPAFGSLLLAFSGPPGPAG